jgi:hypothetical protein
MKSKDHYHKQTLQPELTSFERNPGASYEAQLLEKT